MIGMNRQGSANSVENIFPKTVTRHTTTQFQNIQKAQIEQREQTRAHIIEQVEREITALHERLGNMSPAVKHKVLYSVDFDSQEVLVKIVDSGTNEVIKEIPHISMRRFRSRFNEALGILFDQKV